MKRIISVLLTITMLLGITASVPLSVSAVTTDKVESGNTYTDEYGNWTYKLTDDGKGYKITYYDDSMTDIEIPSSINGLPVLEIGNYAFSGYVKLTSITIPNSVTAIGSGAFSGCRNLTSITIPNSVTDIGSGAFSGCRNLTSITIPNSVTAIGANTFSGCEKLTDIIIPGSVTTIGNAAFYACSSLINITILSGVTTIGICAFSQCEKLTDIMIPNSVKFIGEEAFCWCNSLTDVYYGGSEDEWHSIFIDYYSNDYLRNAMIHYECGEIIAGDINGGIYKDQYGEWEFRLTTYGLGYEIIGYYGSMVDIEIPISINSLPVLEISDSVDFDSYSLTSITIPNRVTSIGARVFAFCYSLTDITVSTNNNNYTSLDGILFDKSKSKLICYPGGKLLDNYTIPDSVTSIGNYAFSTCFNLTNITISDSVTSIGDSAFQWCASLTNITIPDSVTSIGNYAFSTCFNLTNITISDSVTSIGDSAFQGCNSLTNITIPDSVTSIGDEAFSDCDSLTDIEVSSNNKNYSSLNGVLFDKSQSKLIYYPQGKLLDSYIIPNSVTTIGDSAFSWCENLTNITIPDSVTTIGDYAFCDCENLTNVTLPNSVTTIGNSAFSWCENLTSITIPNNVAIIGSSTFYRCSNLRNIIIPNSVTFIGYIAFTDCVNLTDVYYTGSESEWNSISIGEYNDKLTNATIHYNYVPPIPGDLSGDGALAVNDVIYLLKNIVGDTELTDEQRALADVSGDGRLTVLDAILLQKLILEVA